MTDAELKEIEEWGKNYRSCPKDFKKIELGADEFWQASYHVLILVAEVRRLREMIKMKDETLKKISIGCATPDKSAFTGMELRHAQLEIAMLCERAIAAGTDK